MGLQQLTAFIDHIQAKADQQLKKNLESAILAQDLAAVVAIA
jgi:hypothetical protein